MKKFLVYLLAIVLVAAMGFSIFYLVRDDEVLSITNTSLYKEVGDDITVGVNVKKPKSYTKIKLEYAGDTDIIEYVSSNLNPSKGDVTAKLKATGGGTVRINFQTNNSKFRNLYCDVMIGDGSVENPYYISTAEQLASIGRDGSKYAADLNYELISDINLATLEDGTWDPATVAFTGKLDGNGYTIQNMSIGATSGTSVGLFSEIGVGGVIDNVAFDGVSIVVPSTGNYNIGVVAGVNHGTISRINVKNASIRSNNANAVIGGVVAINESTQSNDGDRSIARIDRAGVNLDLAYAVLNESAGTFDYFGIKGLIGGITAQNHGGTVVNCYSVGNVNIANSTGTSFAGIVNTNKTATFSASSKYNSVYQAANVKDCYSAVSTTTTQDGSNTGSYKVSGVINTNNTATYTDTLTDLNFDYNQIVGNYYAKEMLVTSDVTHTITSGMADVEYGVTGLNLSQMQFEQSERNFVSHVEYRFVKNGNTVVRETVTNEDGSDKVIYWNFSAVWNISGSINNGLPYLTYDNVSVSDALYSATTYVEVSTREGLIAIINDQTRNDTIYLITADIDMAGYAWTPIGTLENPFKGTISGAELSDGVYPTISNLSVNQNTVDGYAGFIGVMESPAIVENLNFTDITVVGNEFNYAGAVAASNGYVSGKQIISGGVIRNITVTDGRIGARIAAGGIVGANYGNVTDVKVLSSDDAEKFVLVSVTPNEEFAYVGGIAGINSKTIDATSRNLVKNKVIIVAYANAINYNSKVRLGGIAGRNTGAISSSAIATSGNGHGITTTNEIVGDPELDSAHYNFVNIEAGGVAGVSEGRIVGCYISTNINISTSSETSLAGGVTAEVIADANSFQATTSKAVYESYYSVFNCVVFDSNISAYKVGGLVSKLSITNCSVELTELRKAGWDIFISSNKNLYEAFSVNKNSENQLASNIVSSIVTSGVTLSGVYTGGLVCTLESGVVTDCSAEVTLNGSNNAGYAYTIERNGLIARSYGVFTFGSGNNYKVTSSNVHQSYTKGIDGKNDPDSKQSGFVVDYAYTVVKGSAENPTLYFDADYYDKVNVSLDKLKTGDLYKEKGWNSSSWLMQDCKDAVSYWTIVNGSLPVQTALAGYKGVIENLTA